MSAWRQLFSLSVTHEFYSPPSGPGLFFAPTAASARWLRRAGCLLRSEAGGLRVLHDGSSLAPPDAETAAGLGFVAFAADPLFPNVTGGWPTDARLMPSFAPEADAGGAGAAVVPLRREGEVPRGLSGAPLRGPVPCLALKLPLPRGEAPAPAPVAYLLPLPSRETVWKYLLVGDWRIDRLEVVDLAGQVAFDPPQPEALADGSAALAIRSRQRIALRERGVQRFELRGRRESAVRARQQVLVKRLPLADARSFALESPAGTPALVSEILVHR